MISYGPVSIEVTGARGPAGVGVTASAFGASLVLAPSPAAALGLLQGAAIDLSNVNWSTVSPTVLKAMIAAAEAAGAFANVAGIEAG